MTERYRANNERRRLRYQTDPEYRARVLAQQAAARAQRGARQRWRYRHDDEYRERKKAWTNAYNARKRGEVQS